MPLFAMALSLFFVFNALGNVPLFVGLLAPYPVAVQRRIIARELCIALGILMLFNFFGDTLLTLLGISRSVLGVAGGTLLFLIAIDMIFSKKSEASDTKPQEPLIVPLAIPIVAGPGAISTVIVYAEQLQNVWISSAVLLMAWIPTFILLFLSSNIKGFLGEKGLVACQKLGGMLISLIAVHMLCDGIIQMLQKALSTSSG